MKKAKIIKQIMLDKDIKVGQLAEFLKIDSRVLSNKLWRDDFTIKDFIKILDVLEYDVKITAINRQNNNTYEVEIE